MPPVRIAIAAVVLIAGVVVVASLGACTHRDLLPAVDPPSPDTFDAERVARGDRLAALGDCFGCHTTADGAPYAGGVPIRTQFGTIFSSNITPDPETGIGRWSLTSFRRAMREGIGRGGQHLYPAFPYPYFRRMVDSDIDALYAFLMTREPVRASHPANTVVVPRALVAGWNLMYLDGAQPGALVPGGDPAWTRGRYLAESLSHCGLCHSPLNALGAEKRDRPYSGGEAEGWHAPALDSSSPSPVPWTVDAMTRYLRHGIADAHAMSAGPMAVVVRNLARADDSDLRAIATYVVSFDRRSDEQRSEQAQKAMAAGPRGAATPAGYVPGVSSYVATSAGASDRAGAMRDSTRADSGLAIYEGTCAQCHDRGRKADEGALELPLAVALSIPKPANLVRIIRDGIVPGEHERSRWMPGYAGTLTDVQIESLVNTLRTFTGLPPWSGVANAVKAAREE